MKKKYLILKIITIIVLILLSIYFYYEQKDLNKKIMNLHKNFEEDNLIDTRGAINLSSTISKLDEITNSLKEELNTNDLEDIKKEFNKTKNSNDEKQKEIIKLKEELTNINNKVENLQTQYNNISNTYNRLLAIKEAGTTYKIENIPLINQYPNYPTGCESVALTILLNYYGINVSPDDVINNLSKGDLPYSEDGILYGGNPELHFIGNPYWDNSYGVYNNPIAEVANIYKSGVISRTNMPFSEVLNLVKENRPVLVWTSMYLAIPFIGNSWIYKPTGEKINWKSNEHAVVLIGYNNSNVIISDPIGGIIRYQSRSTFEDRYNYYGKRAVYY